MESSNRNLAAGSIVWRLNSEDVKEVLLVHRPKYRDWSFPKGKCEEGESLIQTAYRETLEETGFRTRFSRCLGNITYNTLDGIKEVTYWVAKYLEKVREPDHSEIDESLWLNIDEARNVLTNESDKEMFDRFSKMDLDSKVLILLRHGKALPRTEWAEDDLSRPLDAIGTQQAEKIVENLVPFQIEEIHSSSAVRCYETITPIAKRLSLNYFFTDSLSEEVYVAKEGRVFKYIDRLLVDNLTTLVCSHNPILPHYLQFKLSKQGFNITDTFLKPGDAWIVHHIANEIIAVDKIQAPTTA
jgi:8-oxo-dGTP diphosphatase